MSEVVQPETAIAASSAVQRPRTNMVWAVLSLILFCLPLGLVGINYASKVNYLWTTGQVERAQSASKKALIWSLAGMGIGAVAYLVLLFGFLGSGLSSVSGTYSCPELAADAVRISEDLNKGTGNPLLLRVESPRLISDTQATASLPSTGQSVVLRCSGTGYFSSGETATVELTLQWDSDGNQWVYYEAQ
jgi:hypothetical protein